MESTVLELQKQAATIFQERFKTAPAVAAAAPGRLEILGNHTDYNEGFVLSAAVDRGTCLLAAPAPGGGSSCRVYCSVLGQEAAFDLDRLADKRPGEWANYIKGVLVALGRRGVRPPAFNAVLRGNVPLSAGMSSSAALEMAVALAVCRLAGAELPWIELAKAGQEAENQYVGAQTGLLDQFSSLRGRAGCLVFSDFRSLAVETVPVPAGTALVVVNCMVKHVLTNEYNERRQACFAAADCLRARHPAVRTLRDVSMAQLEAARNQLDITAWRRARHVVGENERVLAGIAALRAGDVAAFGRLMLESHESSRLNFENSCAELDILVELGRSLPGALGARLSGGGFGGTTVHLVEAAAAETYAARLATAYRTRTGIVPETMICQAAAGAAAADWRA